MWACRLALTISLEPWSRMMIQTPILQPLVLHLLRINMSMKWKESLSCNLPRLQSWSFLCLLSSNIMAEIKYFKFEVTWEDNKELLVVYELEIYGYSFFFFLSWRINSLQLELDHAFIKFWKNKAIECWIENTLPDKIIIIRAFYLKASQDSIQMHYVYIK